ncbi:DNA replication and repair protein RecF [Candidatus Daviesbacteria bacterium]|nr:DNA replication and repair protein RecF [Candidatus Daviesbacteria bacterium]
MFLKKLNLTNFRNYSNLEFTFDSRPTILIGDNAVGKSNLLEAVYLLSTTKSLRADIEEELIKRNEEFARVEGVLENNTQLMVIINRPTKEVSFKKKVLVNGIARRVVDFIGNLPAVIFYPSDINMVTGSPSLRRWHLDLSLAQIDSAYKKALTIYEQFLTARNRVLKRIREGISRKDELTYWTDGLVEQGRIIAAKRKEFFGFIAALEKPLGRFSFKFIPSEVTVENLIETNGREIVAAATLIGPHRDDFEILQDERNLAHFGSRGEQRTATLAFKLAQLEYMAKILGTRPILLLDDVFSELDASHRAHVVDVVSKQQTIIATVELEHIPQEFLDSSRILKVEDGKIVV